MLTPEVAPPEHHRTIPRPRVFRALDHLTTRAITWVHAPAGAGKTTLLATYLRKHQTRALWYDIDSSDADPNMLLHALRRAAEYSLGRTLDLPPPAHAIAGRYFESLFAELPRGTFLVFDNYQNAAAAPAWNAIFADLCTNIHARARVIVASRVGPPAALAHSCGTGELEILDWNTLRFDEDEIRRFLKSASPAQTIDSAELLALTDGWPAAVALFAKSQAGKRCPFTKPVARTWSGAPQRTAEHNEVVFRFLVKEIFEQLDDSRRGLLLELALLPIFTAEMAAELTERDDAIALLVELHVDHRLVERHGEHNFRFQEMFRSFLLERGRSVIEPSKYHQLSIRAARLLAREKQLRAAVERLTAVKAFDVLAALIEEAAPELVENGQLSTLAHALEQVPRELREQNIGLLFWEAVSAVGRRDQRALAEKTFAEFRSRKNDAGTLSAWAVVVHAIVVAGDDFRALGSWIQKLQELSIEPPSPQLAAKVALAEALARAFSEVGTSASIDAAHRALELTGRYGSADDQTQAACAALLIYEIAGHFERAEDVRRLAREELGQTVLMFDVSSALARGELATAEKLLEETSATISSGSRLARCRYAYARAWLAFERGQLESAERWLRDSERDNEQLGFAFARRQHALTKVIFAGERRDRAAFARAVAELEDQVSCDTSPDGFEAAAALARTAGHLCFDEVDTAELRRTFSKAQAAGLTNPRFLGSRAKARLIEHNIEPDLTARLFPAPPCPIKIRTFGKLEIEVDGKPLAFGRKPPAVPLALLKILVSASEPLATERLTTALWPGYGDAAPRGALDTALYRLRKLLGNEAAIESSLGCIALAPATCWTDVRAFIFACERITRLAKLESPAVEQIERWEQTLLNLYRGPFGAGDDPPLIKRAREHLRRRFVRALAELRQMWARLGETEREAELAQCESVSHP